MEMTENLYNGHSANRGYLNDDIFLNEIQDTKTHRTKNTKGPENPGTVQSNMSL